MSYGWAVSTIVELPAYMICIGKLYRDTKICDYIK